MSNVRSPHSSDTLMNAAVDVENDTDEDAEDKIVSTQVYKLPNPANTKVLRAFELVKTGNARFDEEKKIFLVFDNAWRIFSLFPEKCGCADSPSCCHILAIKHKNALGLKIDYLKKKNF